MVFKRKPKTTRPASDRYKADFTMGIDDFERWSKMIMATSMHMFRIRQIAGATEHLMPAYSVMKDLYIQWRPMMTSSNQEKFDKLFDELRKELFDWFRKRKTQLMVPFGEKKVPLSICDKLEHAQLELMTQRQVLGLGAPFHKEGSSWRKEREIFDL